MPVPASRLTHDYDGELVVFLIGMRINRPWRLDLWLPVFRAMPGIARKTGSHRSSRHG